MFGAEDISVVMNADEALFTFNDKTIKRSRFEYFSSRLEQKGKKENVGSGEFKSRD